MQHYIANTIYTKNINPGDMDWAHHCVPIWCLFIWARLAGLAQFPRSRLTYKSFVKILLCSYERAGWHCFRDLGFPNQDLGKRAGNFATWTFQPGYREEENTMPYFSFLRWWNLRLIKQRKSRYSHPACSLDFTPEWSRRHFLTQIGLKVSTWTETNFISVTQPARSTGIMWVGRWSIVYFPPKLGLKIHTLLTLMEKNLIPESHSWVMNSCMYYIKLCRSELLLLTRPFPHQIRSHNPCNDSVSPVWR